MYKHHSMAMSHGLIIEPSAIDFGETLLSG
jgi:hypothetical protein